MTFDDHPILKGDIVELRAVRSDDYGTLYAIAAEPLIWEQHPVKTRHERGGFLEFFQESLLSRGACSLVMPKNNMCSD